MIKIIRSNDTDSGLAGETIDFDSGNPEQDACDICDFMGGRDFNNYIIINNGIIKHYSDGNLEYIYKDLVAL